MTVVESVGEGTQLRGLRNFQVKMVRNFTKIVDLIIAL